MKLRRHQPFIEKLPEELMSMIFSELTVVELARAQQTCKRWYNIAQRNSTLWTDAAPFFYHIEKWQGLGRKETSLKISGLRKLNELSNHKLDGIVLQSDYNDKRYGYGSLRQIIVKALREHPPTRMDLTRCFLQRGNEGRQVDPCLKLLADNKSLKHLSLCLYPGSTSWQLKLACSLESLDLRCPPLSDCSNKEELIKALMSVQKMKLKTTLERPGDLEFLDKIGKNLQDLELIETRPFVIGGPINVKKTMIRFPKLKKLTLESPPYDTNKSYQLDCPQLQSLTVGKNLLSLITEGQGSRLHELLLRTDTVTHVSISLPDYGRGASSDVIFIRFFGKFRRIEELHVVIRCQSGLQSLANTLPETVSKLAITLEPYSTSDGKFLDRLKKIHDNGGIAKEAKDDDNLPCIFSVHEKSQSKQYKVTIFGRKNLNDLAFGCGM